MVKHHPKSLESLQQMVDLTADHFAVRLTRLSLKFHLLALDSPRFPNDSEPDPIIADS